MGTKLVENVDDSVWQRFVGSCRMDGVKVGVRLSEILETHLKRRGLPQVTKK
jgi:hypothetical protein